MDDTEGANSFLISSTLFLSGPVWCSYCFIYMPRSYLALISHSFVDYL